MGQVLSATLFTYLHIFARVALGSLFAFSSIRKVRDIESFERAIQGFELLPEG